MKSIIELKRIKINTDAILTFLGIVLCIVIVAPFIVSCKYANLGADDFSNMINMANYMEKSYNNVVIASFKFTFDTWKNWLGVYSSSFIMGIIMSIHAYTGSIDFRGETVVLLIFFILSIIIAENSSFVGNNSIGKKWVFIVIMLFIVMNYSSPYEAVYWITGAFNYLLPLSCALIAIALFSDDMIDSKIKQIMFVISSLMACGGTLMVPGFLCSMLLYKIIIARDIEKKKILYFAITVIFAMMNAFAPGNFSRRSTMGHIHLKEAIFDTIGISMNIFKSIVNTRWVIVLFIIIALLSLDSVRVNDNNYRNMILRVVLGLIVCFITVFPFVLGYEGSESIINIPNRALFLIQTVFIFIMGIWVQEISVLCNVIIHEKRIIIASIIVLFLGFYSFDDREMIVSQISDELNTGWMQNSYAQQMDVIDYIKNSEELDVIVYGKIQSSEVAYPFWLEEGTDSWVNDAVARYFGKNSLTNIIE